MDGQKPEETTAPMQSAPGDTVRPQQQAPIAPVSVDLPQQVVQPQVERTTVSTPVKIQQIVEPAEQPQAIQAAALLPASDPQLEAPNNDYSAPVQSVVAPQEMLSWTASEFIAHHKTSGWYAVLLLASCVAAVIVWLITRDIISASVIVLAGGVLATYANRKPRQLSYQLDPAGLTVGQRHYNFNDFRSFSVVPEGAFSSIIFAPLKRFGTPITIYFDPDDEDSIIQAISSRLPHSEHKPDLVDGIMSRIRF